MQFPRYISLFFFLLCFTTCVDPYTFDFDEEFERSFVVDGYFTNVLGQHEVRVSRSTFLGEFNGVIADFVTSADVSIIDDLGNKIVLTHQRDGIYVTPPNVAALPDRSYKVRVELTNNRAFESSFERLEEPLTIENNIQYQIDTREVLNDNNAFVEESGLSVYTNIVKAPINRYYRWDIDHYFIIESDLGPGFDSPAAQEGLVDEELRFCFIREFPVQALNILRDITNKQATGQEYPFDLEFLEINKRFEHQFVIESTLLALPKKAYDYWSDVQSLAENTGGLFDAAPFTVIGNIREVTDDPEEEVIGLGYFGVYNADVKRAFIELGDLGLQSTTFPDCEIPPSPGPPRPDPCADCRLYSIYFDNYENNPPDWWDY